MHKVLLNMLNKNRILCINFQILQVCLTKFAKIMFAIVLLQKLAPYLFMVIYVFCYIARSGKFYDCLC